MTNCGLMKVNSIAEYSLGAFCNTFDMHKAIVGIENQFSVVLIVAVLHNFYCSVMCQIASGKICQLYEYIVEDDKENSCA